MRRLSPAEVLVRLAADPRASFSLSAFDAADVALLRPLAVFRPEPREGDGIDCPTPTGAGCLRVVGKIGGELMAICPCEAHEAPMRLDTLELTAFQIDIGLFARALALTFGVSGATAPVSERCWYLGQATVDGRRVGLVLGLFDERHALNELRALPGVLPDGGHEILCVTPTYAPPPEVERHLAAIHVRTMRLDSFEPKDSIADLMRPATQMVPLVALTDVQEQEFRAAAFQCRWPIVIFGQTAKGGLNVIEIDGDERRLGRATFPLFMRLVTGLFETENGFVPVGRFRGGGGLADEGYYKSESAYQALNQLRMALGDEFRELVEVGDQMVRLSTHRAYVRVDCDVLAQHRDDRIRELAKRISLAATGEGVRT